MNIAPSRLAEVERFMLPKDEMAFRLVYRHLLVDESITVVFRPGKRLCGEYRGYCVNQRVTAKIIEHLGSDRERIPPVFLSEPQKSIVIRSVTPIKLTDLRPSDFFGSSPDVQSVEDLRWHLGLIYNISYKELTDDAMVTKFVFNYEKES